MYSKIIPFLLPYIINSGIFLVCFQRLRYAAIQKRRKELGLGYKKPPPDDAIYNHCIIENK